MSVDVSVVEQESEVAGIVGAKAEDAVGFVVSMGMGIDVDEEDI